jgi:release factor glutamine methyltransferase
MSPGDRPSAARIEFTYLLLELEAELVELGRTLAAQGVEAVLLNGQSVRPALAYGRAESFTAQLLVHRRDLARAERAMAASGWRASRRRPWAPSRRYWRKGVAVTLWPTALARVVGPARGLPQRSLARGRYGLLEPVPPASRQSLSTPRRGPGPHRPRAGAERSLARAVPPLAAQALAGLDALLHRVESVDFDGLEIEHGPGVFAPGIGRQLVRGALERIDDRPGVRVVEVGTGSGAVALAIAAGRPAAEIVAIDVSARALGWARRNRRRLAVRNVRFLQGSLLEPLPQPWLREIDAILANLPCVPPRTAAERRAPARRPAGTITGFGADGLGLVRALARQARDALADGGVLVLQVGDYQVAALEEELAGFGYQPAVPPHGLDGAGLVVPATWPGWARG